jgi:hypothetical protein
MVVAPDDKAVTTPVPEFTVPIVALLLLHTPPVTAFAYEAVPHTSTGPVIIAGIAFTITLIFETQPPLVLYLIVDVPADRPVTTPDEASTVATKVFRLLHVPPLTALLNVIVLP